MSQTLLYLTFETPEDARRIGSELVKQRLVACVNLLPGMKSLYWWEGKVESADEVVVIAKTRSDLVETVTKRVKELHNYDVPCIVAMPVEGGNSEFLAWIDAETR